ncbi:MAG TPA: hypothetical protein V6C57_24875 [Coleofasciculaceae cyanobacterium]
MNALACLFIFMLYSAVVLVWKTVDELQPGTYLESRGSGRKTGDLAIDRLESRGSGRKIGDLAIDRLESRGSGRTIRPVRPSLVGAVAGLPA